MNDLSPESLSADRILANLKMHIELFDPLDIDAGVWAYKAVASTFVDDPQQIAEKQMRCTGIDVGNQQDRGKIDSCLAREDRKWADLMADYQAGLITIQQADARFAIWKAGL